jgi:tRNA A-37 threonylcarbamoyl transferase component Bud32
VQHLVLNGIRWQVHPEFANALPRLLSIPPELVKTTPSKVVHRHRLEDRCFYVKRSYHDAATWRSLSAALVPPRNRMDWQIAGQLGPRQVEVVPHVAYGERWSWRGLNETALVTLAPEGYVTLHEVPDLWRPHIQRALGSFLARVHDAGVAMRDLHAKNLLFSVSSNTFCLVDLDTVTIRSHVNLNTRVDHLARLHYRLPLSADFYDAYSQSAHINPDTVAKLAPLHRRSRCLKRNLSFDRVRQGGLNWWVRRSALNPKLLRILAAPDVFLEREARILKREDHAIVGSGHGVVVKRVHNRNALSQLKNLLRPSPARRAYLKAYHLELAGIPSPKPVAMSARRFLGLPVSSYFIMDVIPGATHLHAWRGDWRQTIRDVADLIGQLHRAGFVHRDLKETNIVFDLSGRPSLLDLDGLEFIHTVPDPRAASDLARLLRGAARSFTLKRSDLVRFLARYCEVRGGLMWRDWWHVLARNKAVTRVLPPTLRERPTQLPPTAKAACPDPAR